MIMTEVFDPPMKRSQPSNSLRAVGSAKLLATDCSRSAAEFRKFPCEVLRVLKMLPIRSSQKMLDANINPDGRICTLDHLDIAKVAGKDHKPSVGLELDRRGLNDTFDWPVNPSLNLPYVLNPEFVVRKKPDPVAIGWKLHGVEATFGFEARIPWLPALFDSSKESPVGLVEPSERGLGAAKVSLGIPRIGQTHICEPSTLIVVVDGDFIIFVGRPSLLEGGVVEPAVSLQHGAELTLLVGVRVESEFEGLAHGFSHPIKGAISSGAQGKVALPCGVDCPSIILKPEPSIEHARSITQSDRKVKTLNAVGRENK
jgi:hypothetical protein